MADPKNSQGGGEGDADLTFDLLMKNREALNSINELSAALERAQRSQTGFSGGSGAPGSVEWWTGRGKTQPFVVPPSAAASGQVPTANNVLTRDVNLKQLRNKNFSFGAEGVRIGHVRLSRSGFGISEKTLADRGLIGAVLGGQVAGRAIQGIGKYMELRRRGEDPVKAVYQASGGVITSLSRAAIEIFGFRQFAEGFNSIFAGTFLGGAPAEDFSRLYEEAWEHHIDLLDYRREQVRELRYKGDLKNRIEQAKRLTNVWAQELNSPSADLDFYVEQFRHELADEKSEARAMTRSLTGRPLWKVLNYSANEGIG